MAKSGDFIAAVPRRKSTVWTREKITQLIELYRQHDCLWNHYTESYKNKELRTKAIEAICSSLRITKMDFGKKIHNLRNQFNSEMKKLERRVEETGGECEPMTEACRWKHFQSLRFLRDVIEPRPGGYQSKLRKVDLHPKFDYTTEDEAEQHHTQSTMAQSCSDPTDDITDCQFEDAITIGEPEAIVIDQLDKDGFQNITSPESARKAKTAIDESNKLSLMAPNCQQTQGLGNTDLTKSYQLQGQKSQLKSHSQEIACEDSQYEQNSGCCRNVNRNPCRPINSESMCKQKYEDTFIPTVSRDQWDAFGELIASEFRHLNSDTSRKKLKRKIMQAMLEVGEEDDASSV